jgi:hypothetical protein
MTKRQREIKALLENGMGALAISEELGITRNAVYQQIQRMRNHGSLPTDFTPTGTPPRETRPVARPLGASAWVRELGYIRDELDRLSQRLSALM